MELKTDAMVKVLCTSYHERTEEHKDELIKMERAENELKSKMYDDLSIAYTVMKRSLDSARRWARAWKKTAEHNFNMEKDAYERGRRDGYELAKGTPSNIVNCAYEVAIAAQKQQGEE